MSTFLKRKTLIGSALALGLLAAMQIPAVFAGEGQGEHEHSSAASHDSGDKPAVQPHGQSSGSQQMNHGQMDHGSMDHDDMDHDKMKHEHDANKAEAGSNHDH
ncbi:hypothetical protein NVV94_14500 [Pseudomonas sp. LS1212]|uniref:hypothetical protein n=1 Tax=Pseudomonas sp. LS1212 TaxID=2972478 RepID=UPI00215BE6B2|nr:hypothetical protein [Pseudomonas sp. LS1212]UVJ41915.1 hypothetical protein NVV94_14500 [Pseudomonas sp. LS1212]